MTVSGTKCARAGIHYSIILEEEICLRKSFIILWKFEHCLYFDVAFSRFIAELNLQGTRYFAVNLASWQATWQMIYALFFVLILLDIYGKSNNKLKINIEFINFLHSINEVVVSIDFGFFEAVLRYQQYY